MAHDPLSAITTKKTHQMEPIPGRSAEMVQNAAGGYVFPVGDWVQLLRFLILGTTGGTYYVREADHTKQNAEMILRLIDEDGLRVIEIAKEVSLSGRAAKQEPTLFVLAACAGAKNPVVRAAALAAMPEMCRIGTHLFTFLGYVEQFRGWGKGLRRAVEGWYLDRDENSLRFQLVKYQQRKGWSHGDALRLAHPGAAQLTGHGQPGREVTPGQAAAFDWALHGSEGELPREGLIEGFELLKSQMKSPTDAANIISQYRMPWEGVPSELLNEPVVWEAMLPDMGIGAFVRHLGKLTGIGVLTPASAGTKQFVELVQNADAVAKSRFHPMNALVALRTYAQGHGEKGSLTWAPVGKITDALDGLFYSAFGNVEPAGKNTMVAIDVSGSMSWASSKGCGGVLFASEIAAAMAMVTVHTESVVYPVAFETNITPLSLSNKQRLDDVIKTIKAMTMGGTDAAKPMQYALANHLPIETFIVYSDGDTWAGTQHVCQALEDYRQKSGIDARLANVAIQSTPHTITDPKDKGSMDFVGFDTSTPQAISIFSAGLLGPTQ